MKILFATDGSAYAAEAAKVLAQMETVEPTHLTVVSATYLPDDIRSGTVRPWYADWKEKEAERIEEHYRQINALLHHLNGTVAMRQIDGTPTRTILETAYETDADLIVLGAKGHSMLERMLIGSVSDAVATHAPCSVLVVRPESDTDKPDDACRFRNINIAYDGSPISNRAVQEFRTFFQWPPETSVHLTSVVPTLDSFGKRYATFVSMESDNAKIRSQLEEAGERLQDACADVHCDLLHAPHVGEAILKNAASLKSDLIMLGESGHSPLGALLLGSTSKYVLRHASSSVWISRPKKVRSVQTTQPTIAADRTTNDGSPISSPA